LSNNKKHTELKINNKNKLGIFVLDFAPGISIARR